MLKELLAQSQLKDSVQENYGILLGRPITNENV